MSKNDSQLLDKSGETTESGLPFARFAASRAANRRRFVEHFKVPIVRAHLGLATELAQARGVCWMLGPLTGDGRAW